mmetsp:Transcript_63592/g.101215  ORF Transcript_63592/g.101215 Transcript_63592/m.101215 type:complete len:209 (-) Transcript_63592:153-779(-)
MLGTAFMYLLIALQFQQRMTFAGVVTDAMRENSMAIGPLHVNSNISSHWFPFFSIQAKLVYVDATIGVWVVHLKATPGTVFAPHRHAGKVYVHTISGHWGYLEHNDEWIAKTGDFVLETDGSTHTFYATEDSPEDVELLCVMHGALLYQNEYGDYDSIADWRVITNLYYEWAEKNNIVPFDVTRPRARSPDPVWKPKPAQTDRCPQEL